MHILMTGGTGFIGQALIKQLKANCKFTVLTRTPNKIFSRLGHDINCISSLNQLENLNAFNAVINLAGEPIADKRWTEKQKNKIKHSRWDITQDLVKLFKRSEHSPKVFISGSAIGFYGRQDAALPITESFSSPHDEFTHQVCSKWESIAQSVESSTRLCILRTGIVIGKRGGALKKMLPAFKLGIGGPLGEGKQMMSWIHIDDMVDGIIHLLESETSRGIYNLTAPNPVDNKTFSQTLAKTLNRPCFITTPAWVLNLLLGELADLLLTGQNVVPERLLQEGFTFRFTHLDEAFKRLD